MVPSSISRSQANLQSSIQLPEKRPVHLVGNVVEQRLFT